MGARAGCQQSSSPQPPLSSHGQNNAEIHQSPDFARHLSTLPLEVLQSQRRCCSSYSDPGPNPHKTELSRFGSSRFWERPKPEPHPFPPPVLVSRTRLLLPQPGRVKSLCKDGRAVCRKPAKPVIRERGGTERAGQGKSLSSYKAQVNNQPTLSTFGAAEGGGTRH